MKRIYDAITAAIQGNAAQFDLMGVRPPETLDIHLGQELNPEEFEFALPAMFYDYSIDYTAESLYVYLYVIQEFEDDTENFAANRENGEKFFDFLTALKRCVNGAKATGKAFGRLRLYQEQPQQNPDFYCHLITLRCTYRWELDEDLIPETPKQQYTLVLKKGRLRDSD